MAFSIYPDTATAWELSKPDFTPIRLESGEAMAVFVPVAELVGPDLAADDRPTTFLRFALNGAPIPPSAPPSFELIAHAPDPGPPARVDPGTATSPAAAVALTDAGGAHVADARFEPPYAGNIYFMKVAIRRPGTTLSVRIANTTGLRRDLVWVAADNPAETRQPWLHATFRDSPQISIQLWEQPGLTYTPDPIRIANFGTGPATITGIAPPLAQPVAVELPQMPIQPNQGEPALAQLSFLAPPRPFDTQWTMAAFVTANRVDPGPFGSGHNLSFSYRGTTLGPPVHLPGEVPPGLWPFVTVPDVTGRERDEAVALIRAAGLAARVLGRSDIKGARLCVAQEPAPGASLTRGQRVTAHVTDPALFDGQVLHDDPLVPGPTLKGRGGGSRPAGLRT